MKLRISVKEYQQRLIELDTVHSRANDRLAAAKARRAKVLEQQDRIVAAAQEEVHLSVAAMAQEVGPQVTASLLGLEVARVRRLLRCGTQGKAPSN